eukprot:scaffold126518_cov32-Tisochrysis_lutea.AAC.2
MLPYSRQVSLSTEGVGPCARACVPQSYVIDPSSLIMADATQVVALHLPWSLNRVIQPRVTYSKRNGTCPTLHLECCEAETMRDNTLHC